MNGTDLLLLIFGIVVAGVLLSVLIGNILIRRWKKTIERAALDKKKT